MCGTPNVRCQEHAARSSCESREVTVRTTVWSSVNRSRLQAISLRFQHHHLQMLADICLGRSNMVHSFCSVSTPSAMAARWLRQQAVDWCELAGPTTHKHGPPLEHVRSHAVVSGFHGRTERRSFSNLVFLPASAPRFPRIVVDVRRSRQKMWTSVFTHKPARSCEEVPFSRQRSRYHHSGRPIGGRTFAPIATRWWSRRDPSRLPRISRADSLQTPLHGFHWHQCSSHVHPQRAVISGLGLRRGLVPSFVTKSLSKIPDSFGWLVISVPSVGPLTVWPSEHTHTMPSGAVTPRSTCRERGTQILTTAMSIIGGDSVRWVRCPPSRGLLEILCRRLPRDPSDGTPRTRPTQSRPQTIEASRPLRNRSSISRLSTVITWLLSFRGYDLDQFTRCARDQSSSPSPCTRHRQGCRSSVHDPSLAKTRFSHASRQGQGRYGRQRARTVVGVRPELPGVEHQLSSRACMSPLGQDVLLRLCNCTAVTLCPVLPHLIRKKDTTVVLPSQVFSNTRAPEIIGKKPDGNKTTMNLRRNKA